MGREMWLRTPAHPWLPFSQKRTDAGRSPSSLHLSPFSSRLLPSSLPSVHVKPRDPSLLSLEVLGLKLGTEHGLQAKHTDSGARGPSLNPCTTVWWLCDL